MESQPQVLNQFLVEVFHEILKTEEEELARVCPDLSLRELHLIETVCLAAREDRDNRASAIAAAQRVTAGTLTTVVGQLERKGYVTRQRDAQDRRAVRILPTPKGWQANDRHARFHQEMVAAILDHLTPEEAQVFVKGLGAVARFCRNGRRD